MTVLKSKTFVYPWDMASRGARSIASNNEYKLIRLENSKFQGDVTKTVINWGAHKLSPEALKCHILNHPDKVSAASEKVSFFKISKSAIHPPRVPEYTTDKKVALDWVAEGIEVMGRKTTRGKSGDGIVFFEDVAAFSDCPLYTQYKKKKEEYRIHIAFGDVILIQKKVLRATDDEGRKINPKSIDFRVRNLANGFIFQRENVSPHQDVIDQAKKAQVATGLDFGAYDVIFNEHEQQAYVLEVNTAPGLEGSTINNYCEAFKNHLNQ